MVKGIMHLLDDKKIYGRSYYTNFSAKNRFWFREGNGTPLQYCCLENPMDGGAVGCSPWGRQESDTTEATQQQQQQQEGREVY